MTHSCCLTRVLYVTKSHDLIAITLSYYLEQVPRTWRCDILGSCWRHHFWVYYIHSWNIPFTFPMKNIMGNYLPSYQEYGPFALKFIEKGSKTPTEWFIPKQIQKTTVISFKFVIFCIRLPTILSCVKLFNLAKNAINRQRWPTEICLTSVKDLSHTFSFTWGIPVSTKGLEVTYQKYIWRCC